MVISHSYNAESRPLPKPSGSSYIRTKLIPALTGRPPPNDIERNLLALPARLGGIALANPTVSTDSEFLSSTKITAPLTEAILRQDPHYSAEIIDHQLKAKLEVHTQRREHSKQLSEHLSESLTHSQKRSMTLAQEKGASSWLTSLPIEEYSFALHKGAFHDALGLRYNWQPIRTPLSCCCGAKFSVEHVLSCPKGGFPSLRHNEIRDVTANFLTEVCSNVSIEPELQPITGEALRGATSNSQPGARLDVAANGFWGGRFQKTYLDVRVFNPFAPSNSHSNLTACYRKHELIQKRAYEQRIREIENASFTPLVLSATGGLAVEATVFYKRLASLLAMKWDQPYSSTLSWLRCRLNFSLLRSAIQCIRGARSSIGQAMKTPPPMDLAMSELQIN